MRCALLQTTSSDQPGTNLHMLRDMVQQAAAQGAGFVLTPEVSNCLSASRAHQQKMLHTEASDPTLKEMRALAAERGIWLLLGSLALKADENNESRFVNRSLLISPTGKITARYDKIHMFDVNLGPGETYRESDGYRPGDRAVVAHTPFATIGLTICYDVRFPHLFHHLAQAGAQIITVPAAFSPVTGKAHWHTLLRARAIETGCYILAPAQTGTHPRTKSGAQRKTYGHTLAVAPWGDVLADAGAENGVILVDFHPEAVEEARRKLPVLRHTRPFHAATIPTPS